MNTQEKSNFKIAVEELRIIANKIDAASGSPKWTEPQHNALDNLVWRLEKKLAAL